MEQTLKTKSPLDLKTAIAKAKHYCTTGDRSQQELRDKLYDLGAWRNEVEETIVEMIVEGFLSEERFAMAYVSAKFKLHGWGKIKLKKHLRDKRVPEKLIQQALNTIDPEDYQNTPPSCGKTPKPPQRKNHMETQTETHGFLTPARLRIQRHPGRVENT